MNDSESDEQPDTKEGALSPTIRLDHFLKSEQLVESGGQAKWIIQGGLVSVNGEVELRRRRKLTAGDLIAIEGGPTVTVANDSQP